MALEAGTASEPWQRGACNPSLLGFGAEVLLLCRLSVLQAATSGTASGVAASKKAARNKARRRGILPSPIFIAGPMACLWEVACLRGWLQSGITPVPHVKLAPHCACAAPFL